MADASKPTTGIHIYGFWRSIASFRVRVALKLKGLPFEETPIDILSGEQFKPGYEAVNAERVVPTFTHEDAPKSAQIGLRLPSACRNPTIREVEMSLKVFVAGGTGVLGRASLPALVAAGHSVRSTARGADKAALVRSLGAEPVECDLYDFASVRKAIAGCDVLIRLTTKIGSMTKIRDSKMWEETNRLRTEGARVLVDAAIQEGVPTYIHESVTFVYADGGTRWLTEESRTDAGRGAILHAALEGEREAERITKEGGKGIVLRFGRILRSRCSFHAGDAGDGTPSHAGADRSRDELFFFDLCSRRRPGRGCRRRMLRQEFITFVTMSLFCFASICKQSQMPRARRSRCACLDSWAG